MLPSWNPAGFSETSLPFRLTLLYYLSSHSCPPSGARLILAARVPKADRALVAGEQPVTWLDEDGLLELPAQDTWQACDRIEAPELAKVVLRRSGAAKVTSRLIAASSFFGLVALILGINEVWWLLATPFVSYGVEVGSRRFLSGAFGLKKSQRDSVGQRTTARGVKAGKWVCLEKEYNEVRRRSRAIYGRNSESPPTRYRLAIATFPLDGNHQLVSFSDGESVTWHSASTVIFIDCPILRREYKGISDQELSRTAAALTDLVKLLYDSSNPLPQQSIFDHFDSGSKTIANRAIEIASWWDLISVSKATNRGTSGNATLDHRSVNLTTAGKDWHLASLAPSILRAGGKMQNPRHPKYSIHIGTVSGGVIYAGNDISGSPTANVYNAPLSGDQVLSSLKVLLGLQEIPWINPDLAEVRHVIEEAIRRQNPQMSGLRRAFNKLAEVCGQIAIGVLSNGTYQILLQHFR